MHLNMGLGGGKPGRADLLIQSGVWAGLGKLSHLTALGAN